MAYFVSAVMMENQSVVSLKFGYPMSTFCSVLKWSRFQRIGYVLHAYWQAVALANYTEAHISISGPVTDALMKYDTGLAPHEIETIISLPSRQEQFDFTWSTLSDDEKQREVAAETEYWDNFWPGFDDFKRYFEKPAPAQLGPKLTLVPV